MNINKVLICGRITRDIEKKALPSGVSVANFSLATNRVFKDKDGNKQESAEFHNIVAFGKQADTIEQYCKKGQELYVEGRMQTRSWEKEGEKRYATEVILEQFQFGAKAGDGKTESKPEEDTIKDTDIPF